jgi:hypothetical protein
MSEKAKITKAHKQASLIFTGRVVSVKTVTTTDTTHYTLPNSGRDTLLVTRGQVLHYAFAIIQQLKGKPVDSTVVIVTLGSGTSCDVSYAVGSEQLVYAYTLDLEFTFGNPGRKVAPYFPSSPQQPA